MFINHNRLRQRRHRSNGRYGRVVEPLRDSHLTFGIVPSPGPSDSGDYATREPIDGVRALTDDHAAVHLDTDQVSSSGKH